MLASTDLIDELLGARQGDDAALADRFFLSEGLALVDLSLGNFENARLEAFHLLLELATLKTRDVACEVLDGAVSVRVVQLW